MTTFKTTLMRAGTLLVASLLLVGTFAVARKWFRTWGASEADARRPLPGDEIIPRPVRQGTRAIDIAAPAEAVWPWLAQTGQDRGGFHSYELLEDLAGAEMENLDQLDPALQRWKVGDKLWMYPPRKAGGAGHAVLMSLEEGRFLAFGSRQIVTPVTAPIDGSWTFIVEPVDAGRSRLIIRGRDAGGLGLLARAATAAIFDPAHFVMERRMMEVIKARAEGRPVSAARDNVQVALWIVTFAVLLAAAVAVMLGWQPRLRLAVFVAAGLLFQFLSLGQPTPWLGIPLLVALVVAGWLPPSLVRGRGSLALLARPSTVEHRLQERWLNW